MAVFIDFEEAFDIVQRKGLLIKLKKFGINGRMFDWIADFITDQTFQVRVRDALSPIYTKFLSRLLGALKMQDLKMRLQDMKLQHNAN